MNKENDSFGNRLKQALLKLDIKQRELADKINIDETKISRYIKNRAEPSISTVAKIAKALNVSADYLLGLKEEMTPIHENDPWAEDIQIIKDSYTTLSLEERYAIIQLVRAMRRDKDGHRPR